MRYFAGFIGGFVVAVLLLVFQQQLIGSDHEHVPQPAPTITLASVFESRPPEEIDRRRREMPPPPDPLVNPVAPSDLHAAPDVHPVVPDIPAIDGAGVRYGVPPQIDHGPVAMDGDATVRSAVEPQYPTSALRNRTEGEVEVEFTVLADGSVADVEVIRANPRGVFEQSAVRAVLRWQFAPKRQNGVAMPARVRQVIQFDLPGA